MAKPNTIEEHIQDIINDVAGGDSLTSACGKRGYQALQFYREMDKSEEVSKDYARAVELRTETMMEDIMTDAKVGSGDVARDRLVVDTKKWLACKVLPKVYGDKKEITHTGSVTVMPLIEVDGEAVDFIIGEDVESSRDN